MTAPHSRKAARIGTEPVGKCGATSGLAGGLGGGECRAAAQIEQVSVSEDCRAITVHKNTIGEVVPQPPRKRQPLAIPTKP